MPIEQSRLYRLLEAAQHIERHYTTRLGQIDQLLAQFNRGQTSGPQFIADLSLLLTDPHADVARSAAILLIEHDHWKRTHKRNARIAAKRRGDSGRPDHVGLQQTVNNHNTEGAALYIEGFGHVSPELAARTFTPTELAAIRGDAQPNASAPSNPPDINEEESDTLDPTSINATTTTETDPTEEPTT